MPGSHGPRRLPHPTARLWRATAAVLTELRRPGESAMGPRGLRAYTTGLLSAVQLGANLIGAVIVVALLVLGIIPLPPLAHRGSVRLHNGLLAAAYLLVTLPVGWWLGRRIIWSRATWLSERRTPTEVEKRALLYGPGRLFLMQLTLWFGGALLFSLYNLSASGRLAGRVAIVVCLTGFVTATCAYLSAERVLRSLTARALRSGVPAHRAVPGVVTRTLLAWGLGTIVPVGGLLGIGIFTLAGDRTVTRHALGLSTIVLTATAILVGFIAVFLAAQTISDPIRSVRRALAQVQRGDFSVRVPVYDASEIGQLQLGFNAMADGLAERERIREAFGTYVDPDVAARIIDSGTNLSGESVEVTCMFLDVRDFTGFAERTPPEAVVSTLNRLFELAVPIVHAQEGRIDKFVGDGLLAVFGAPRKLADHAPRALAAAEQIAGALNGSGLGLSIGIGLNSGPVLAGNVGGGGRFEFSVIGDTVNVAARVEAATRHTGDVILLSDATRVALGELPPGRLSPREGISLKGKHNPVALFAPVTP